MTERSHEPVSDETLVDLASGQLDDEVSARVVRALAASPALARRAEEIGVVVRTLIADDSIAPPPTVLERVHAKVAALAGSKRAAAPGPGAVGAWRHRFDEMLRAAERVVATLVIDSRRDVALGVRGTVESHHLMYDSEAGRVDIEVWPAGDGDSARIVGQVTWERGAAPTLVAAEPQDGSTSTGVEADDEGSFVLDVPPGRYELLVVRADSAIRVSDVDVAGDTS